MNSSHFCFLKTERLRSRQDFSRLKSAGTKVSSAHFVVVREASSPSPARFGITVSRKVGNAVIRNRVKRMLREFYRHHKHLFPSGDYCIIARQQAALLDSAALCRDLERLLCRFKK